MREEEEGLIKYKGAPGNGLVSSTVFEGIVVRGGGERESEEVGILNLYTVEILSRKERRGAKQDFLR